MSLVPTFVSSDLSSNRNNALPADTLQIVLFYDGARTCSFSAEYMAADGTLGRIAIDGIQPFSTVIPTAQYTLNGARLTGNFSVKGVVANGVVDGLAFGLFWRDAEGHFHILRSNSADKARGAAFVSAWPLGMDNSVFASRAPQVTDGFARGTAFAVISGAKLLADGNYSLTVY